jgi:serine/threonine protein phosphatase PrpC
VKTVEELREHAGDMPELGSFFAKRNVMTRSLGEFKPKEHELQLGSFEVQPGDRLLLTSDGVPDNLTFDEIQELALKHRGVEELAAYLVERARQRSRLSKEENVRAKKDDMTAVAVEIK